MLKKILLPLSFIGILTISKGQVSINSTQVDTHTATLNVKSNPENLSKVDGIIPPRFTKTELINKKSPSGEYSYNNAHKGAYVFVTDIDLANGITDIPETKGIVESGLHYFNGKIWVGISSELGNISIYGSASSINDAPNQNGTGPQNFDTQSKALFLNFSDDDIIYESVTDLKQGSFRMSSDGTQQVSSYFEILEDGLYEISAYIVLNPYRGDLSLENSSFVAINLFASKEANIKTYGPGATAPDEQITGIRAIIVGAKGGVPNIIYIPPTIVKFQKNDQIFLSVVNPPLQLNNNTGQQVAKSAAVKKNNISRFFNSIEISPFEKYISIRKL